MTGGVLVWEGMYCYTACVALVGIIPQMLNSLSIRKPLPTTAFAFLSVLVWGICKIIFFHENYFTSSTAIPYRIHSCHGNIGGKREQKKKGESIQSWQGNNWFHYIQPADSLYHQWQGDGRREGACVCVWAVINYCPGQSCETILTDWMRPNLYPSDISQPPTQESGGAETNPMILIKYFLALQCRERPAVYTAKAPVRFPCSVQPCSLR